MTTWTVWFVVWLAIGFAFLVTVRKAARKYRPARGASVMLGWILFSAGAAEVTRYYLTIFPFPARVWVVAGLGVASIGTIGGLATGWFIGGRSAGRTIDVLAGIIGASIAAWAEITSSYSHLDCAVALILVGAVFATLATRLYIRAKSPFEELEEIVS